MNITQFLQAFHVWWPTTSNMAALSSRSNQLLSALHRVDQNNGLRKTWVAAHTNVQHPQKQVTLHLKFYGRTEGRELCVGKFVWVSATNSSLTRTTTTMNKNSAMMAFPRASVTWLGWSRCDEHSQQYCWHWNVIAMKWQETNKGSQNWGCISTSADSRCKHNKKGGIIERTEIQSTDSSKESFWENGSHGWHTYHHTYYTVHCYPIQQHLALRWVCRLQSNDKQGTITLLNQSWLTVIVATHQALPNCDTSSLTGVRVGVQFKEFSFTTKGTQTQQRKRSTLHVVS